MTVPRFEPDRILAALNDHGVRYIVIGGLAGLAHGSPIPTVDVDVTPERDQANLDRLSAALTELGARIRTHAVPDGLPFSHSGQSLADAGVWNLVTRYGDLDISFVPNGTEGFADLDRDATDEEVLGVTVRIASLADVIRSKQAANRPKDQRALPVLRRILAERYQR